MVSRAADDWDDNTSRRFDPHTGARAAALGRVDAKKKRQAQVLAGLRRGLSFDDAAASVGVDPQTVRLWRRQDPGFQQTITPLLQGSGVVAFHGLEGRVGDEFRVVVKENGGFVYFQRTYMGSQIFPHQQNVVDCIEGRPPSWLHESMTYREGSKKLILVNMPPEHAKSATFTVDYVVYRICMNPDIRIKIISANLDLARQFLYAIKARLRGDGQWSPLRVFMPEGGFAENAESWTTTEIYLGGRESKEKDPTIQALGIGGQVYGARANLILVDDPVSLANAHQWEQHERWLKQEVRTRLGPTGRLLVLGTRVAPYELYAALNDGERFSKGYSPWTYLAMPALLDESDPDHWVTLWPKSDRPFDSDMESDEEETPGGDGLFRRWDTETLGERRDEIDARTWALSYQQEATGGTTSFHETTVNATIEVNRKCGQLPAGWERGDVLMYGGMDPAMVNYTAAVVIALNTITGELAVVDAINQKSPSPKEIRQILVDWGKQYQLSEWIIESNAFQAYLTRDDELQDTLRNLGVRLTPHQTNAVNKNHAQWGVGGMSELFGTLNVDGQHRGDHKIFLPARDPVINSLREQLLRWYPGSDPKKVRQDLVMALWFAVTRAKQMALVTTGGVAQMQFRSNPYQRQGRMDARRQRQLSDWARFSTRV